MAMTTSQGDDGVVAEINVTPLVDVMLVLLIIFMITAPLLSHREQIALPVAQQKRNEEGPRTITLSMHADGRLFWNDAVITRGDALRQLRTAALQIPQPDLQLRADRDTEHRVLLDLLGDAKAAGMKKIDLVTTPR